MKLPLLSKLTLIVSLFLLSQNVFAQDSTKAKVDSSGGQTPAALAQDSAKAAMQMPKADTAKSAAKPQNTLTISVDMRVRSEFRHGYRNLPVKDTGGAFFINQRSRINLDFKSKKFDLFASIQDARVWGEQDPREGQGGSSLSASPTTTFPVYLFEMYAEPHFSDKFSARIGRQRIIYDNQRLFAENDWRLPGSSHDALRFIYNNKTNFNTELTFAFNQSNENTFTTNYAPLVKNYKYLLVHYLNWKLSDKFILTTLNTIDGYQSSDPKAYTTTFTRFTNGGRLEYASYKWYLTFSGYYQSGKDSSGKKLSAYYIQPEIKFSGIKNLAIRLGMEYLSGQDSTSSKDNNFVPLYGVAHRFMGNLDLFTTFPADVSGGGIINPYLFFQYQNKKTTVRFENHLFYSHTGSPFKGRPTNDKYLGFENDFRLNYKANTFTDIEFGFCWAAVTKSMVIVKNPKAATTDVDRYSKTPYWTYLSVRFTPTLGKITF